MLNQPRTNSFSPSTTSSKPKPQCLADLLIAAIEANRSEINRMDFGDVIFEIKHYSPFALEMTRRRTGDAIFTAPSSSNKPIDTN